MSAIETHEIRKIKVYGAKLNKLCIYIEAVHVRRYGGSCHNAIICVEHTGEVGVYVVSALRYDIDLDSEAC